MPRRAALRRASAVVAILTAAAGCGGNGWKPCHPARGAVLLDGKPIEGAEVWLIPDSDDLKAQNPPIAPYGMTGKDGAFVLTTYVTGDGAPAGRYKARVIWERKVQAPAAEPADDEEGGKRNVLPPRYADPDKSGLAVTVAAGDNTIPAFDLKK